MIKIFRDTFTENELSKIFECTMQAKWEFGLSSLPHFSNNSYPFFKMDLMNNVFFTIDLFERIKSITEFDFELINVYANGNLFGTPGTIHADSLHDDYYTFLIYANTNWDIEWGGKTIFLPENDFFSVCPDRNLSVLFKSNIEHFSEDVSRKFSGLRVTVAYKLRIL